MSDAIVFQDVRKQYGQFSALSGINLTVKQGEFFALLGPNGAGKTTLISILGGLTRASSGNTTVMGYDVHRDYRAARRQVGIVPQELVFDPFFTVRETLRFQSGYFGLRNNDAWIDEILANLGLTDKANTNMRALSGGMKRRVMVAQALVHRPPVIVLDEPTAGVDVELRQTLWAFIQRLNREGHTIVLTTHYLEEAETLCSRIAMMKQGKVIALENKDTLLARNAAPTLSVKLRGDLPDSLKHKLHGTSEGWTNLTLTQVTEVESVLAELRQRRVEVLDLRLNQPDLEAIFVATMQQHGQGAQS